MEKTHPGKTLAVQRVAQVLLGLIVVMALGSAVALTLAVAGTAWWAVAGIYALLIWMLALTGVVIHQIHVNRPDLRRHALPGQAHRCQCAVCGASAEPIGPPSWRSQQLPTPQEKIRRADALSAVLPVLIGIALAGAIVSLVALLTGNIGNYGPMLVVLATLAPLGLIPFGVAGMMLTRKQKVQSVAMLAVGHGDSACTCRWCGAPGRRMANAW